MGWGCASAVLILLRNSSLVTPAAMYSFNSAFLCNCLASHIFPGWLFNSYERTHLMTTMVGFFGMG